MINKNHPKYSEFFHKWNEILNEQQAEIEKCRLNQPLQLDGPENAVRRKYVDKLKKLQKEYSFLYEEK